ncbi:MAG: hypothetical protein NC321_12730 [Clostridium sp.]|nr:hypothetical protein [Clostridium sp.]
MSQTDKKCEVKYNEEIEKKILSFMSKKRKQVVETLYDKKRLSQGELAQTVQTSAASLANILLNFEMYQYQLLDSESEGKRRYYFLTDLGEEFVRSAYRNGQNSEIGNIILHESFQDIQGVISCLEDVKNKYGDKWEAVLDEVLYAGIKQCNIQIEDGEEEIDAFLHSIEKLLLDDYENYSVKIMELMYHNNILRCRLEEFLTIFDVYIPILKIEEKQLNPLQMIDFLQSIVVCDKESKTEEYIQQLQWKNEEYDRLLKLMQYVIKNAEKQKELEIYQYFNRFFAGKNMLGAILAKEVCRACKIMREKIRDEEM